MIRLFAVENQKAIMKSVGMLNDQCWVLAVEFGDICCCQFRIAEGVDFHVYICLFLSQQIQGADIHIAVNQNDVRRGLLYEACQQAEGIVDLAIKEYLLAGLSMGVDEVFQNLSNLLFPQDACLS